VNSACAAHIRENLGFSFPEFVGLLNLDDHWHRVTVKTHEVALACQCHKFSPAVYVHMCNSGYTGAIEMKTKILIMFLMFEKMINTFG
jgi:hypothetical protein